MREFRRIDWILSASGGTYHRSALVLRLLAKFCASLAVYIAVLEGKIPGLTKFSKTLALDNNAQRNVF